MSSRSSNSPKISFPGYFHVGFVKSAHGIRGEVHVHLFAGRADWQSERLHLLQPNREALAPFEIEQIRPHKDGLIARFKGVADRNAAEALRKSQVYIPEEVLQSEEGEPIFLHQISGFEVVGGDGRVLGVVVDFSSNGVQDLIEVLRPGGGTGLIPLVDAFLVDIDFDKKQVHMDLPPGLLDLEEEN